VNGYNLCLPSDNKELESRRQLLPFYSTVFLSEAQKYFDSRRWLSAIISRFYETHRHYGIDLYLDCQRATLIDLNVRENACEIIEVQSMKNITDRHGFVIRNVWQTRVFTSCHDFQRYLDTSETKNSIARTYTFPGDVRICYNSFYFRSLHLNKAETKDFSYIESPIFGYDKNSVQRFNEFYDLKVPKGFYAK